VLYDFFFQNLKPTKLLPP